MKIKAVSGTMLTLLFMSTLTLAFNIQPAKAQQWSEDIRLTDNNVHDSFGDLEVFQGKLFVVSNINPIGVPQEAELFYKEFDGSKWSENIRVTHDTSADAHPDLAVFNGILYMSWHSNRDDPNWDIYISTFDGVAWSEALRITDYIGVDDHSSLTAYDGKLYLFWTSSMDGFGIYYKTYDGNTWTAPQRLSGGLHPSSTAYNGKLYVAWYSGAYVYYKTFDGMVWSEEIPIATQWAMGTTGLGVYNGRLYLLWVSDRDGNWEVYYKTFDGDIWSEDTRVTDNPAKDGWAHLTTYNSRPYLMWQSDRDGDYEIYYRTLVTKTWTVDDDGPADFHTIQEAINAARDGDTIYVRNGTYCENVVVDKNNLTLMGENRDDTIIDGSGSKAVHLIANNVNFGGFTIRNGMDGVYLEWVNGCSVAGNVVTNNSRHGIWLWGSGGNTIIGNTVVSNGQVGVAIDHSAENTLKNNNMTANGHNFALLFSRYPMVIADFIQDIDTSNTVDGKTLYYWVNQANRQVPSNAGYVAIVNSTNIIVRDLNLTRNGQGVLFAYTTDSTIENVNASQNRHGVFLWSSTNNIIKNNVFEKNAWSGIAIERSDENIFSNNRVLNSNHGISVWHSNCNILSFNTASKNYYGISIEIMSNSNLVSNNAVINNIVGILLGGSCYYNIINRNTMADNRETGLVLTTYVANNTFYHNNFINNAKQVSISLCEPFNNIWDDGYPSGGNYWSDYNGTDFYSGPYQNETGSDGIGDTPYVIDANNRDRYPLIKPYGPIQMVFDVIWEGFIYPVTVVSNSTVTDFKFTYALKQISFNVAGPDGTIGVCNVTIPKQLLDGEPWLVLVDANPVTYYIQTENATHDALWFTYTHSTHEVRIIGTWVIGPPPPFVTATVDINPNTLNLRSMGEWITCYIELTEGYNVSDIDIYSIRLNDTFPVSLLPKPPVPVPTEIGDYDNDTVPDLMVKFNMTELTSHIYHVLGIKHGNVTLTISGELSDETPFEGKDTIKVLLPGDLDCDGDVDPVDYILFIGSYGCSIGDPGYDPNADLDSDSHIDEEDFMIFIGNYGTKL